MIDYHPIEIPGTLNESKELCQEIREVYQEAGREPCRRLDDALFSIEVEYQAEHGLDPDDWELAAGHYIT